MKRHTASHVRLLRLMRNVTRSIHELLVFILHSEEDQGHHNGVHLRFVMKFPNHFIVKGVDMSTVVPVDKFVSVAVELEDSFGNTDAALPDGASISWEVADTGLATVTAAADGKSAVVAPTGKEGTTQLKVSVGSIVGVADLQFVAGSLSVIQLNPTVVDTNPNAAPAPAPAAAPADAGTTAAPAAPTQS